MPRITLKPLDDGQKAVEIPIGKTTIGRGPFLGCGDKKVSRNHALLEVTADGEVYLTPTHVNPCFFQPTAESPGNILKKDRPHKLEHGDSFSLLPRAFRYELVVMDDVSSTVSENENNRVDVKTEDKVNGTSEEKENCRDSKNSEKEEAEDETINTNCQQNSKDAPVPEVEDSSQNKKEKEEEEENCEEEEEEEEEEQKTEKDRKTEKEKETKPLPSEKKQDAEFNGDNVPEPTKEQRPADAKEELKKENNVKKDSEKEEEEEEEADEQEAGGSVERSKRTLPDWMAELSSPQKGQKKVLKTAKQHRREKSPGKRKKVKESSEEKPRRKKKEIERLSESGEENVRAQYNQRPSSGRSSRTNRQTRQGLSLDDFVASEDDEEWPSDESEPRIKKKKRSRRKDDDSGSDWEIEHKKTKRVSHKFSSGSESGSDWKTASLKKKKTPRGRRRRSKRAKDDDVSDEEDEEKSQSGTQGKRAPCTFGKKCFRKNPTHLEQFSHPGDSDYESEPEEKQNDVSGSEEEEEPAAAEEVVVVDGRKECPFGVNCYRKNPAHKKEFKHTKKVRPQREASKQGDKKKDTEGKEEPDAYDINDSFLNDDSDEYKPVESGSEYDSSQEVKRLVPPPKVTKRGVTKNKRAKRV